MTMFIKLLIFKLETIDGNRGTAIPLKESLLKRELKNIHASQDMTDKAKKRIQQHIISRVSFNYTILKIK